MGACLLGILSSSLPNCGLGISSCEKEEREKGKINQQGDYSLLAHSCKTGEGVPIRLADHWIVLCKGRN